jgi:hypothetical protein
MANWCCSGTTATPHSLHRAACTHFHYAVENQRFGESTCGPHQRIMAAWSDLLRNGFLLRSLPPRAASSSLSVHFSRQRLVPPVDPPTDYGSRQCCSNNLLRSLLEQPLPSTSALPARRQRFSPPVDPTSGLWQLGGSVARNSLLLCSLRAASSSPRAQSQQGEDVATKNSRKGAPS